MLIEIHMLKNFAPTNLNRDDTGAPKSCRFGDVERGRISSQCLKRSWRKSSVIENDIGKENLGVRTRKLPELVSKRLIQDGYDLDVAEAAGKKVSGFGNKSSKETEKGNQTAQVAFYSEEDIEEVVRIIKVALEDCKTVKEIEKLKAADLQKQLEGIRPITLDIALFGRMVTSDAFNNVEASMQVAHAISTNRLYLESDFYVAMDDLVSGESNEDIGAGMMGDVDYNSSCYYIYASLDTDKLRENMKNSPNADEIVNKAVPAIIRAMAFSNPSGKQNTFAGHSLPSLVLVECKTEKIPVSYVNAFVKPAAAYGKKDLIEDSIEKLADEVKHTDEDFGLDITKRLWFCAGKYRDTVTSPEKSIVCSSLNDLLLDLSSEG